jgi:hypothetical protein
VDEGDLQVEDGSRIDPLVESYFGRKAAMCLVSVNWKHKEISLKHICKQSMKAVQRMDSSDDLEQLIKASTAAVGISCLEKVIKVLNLSLQLFSSTVQA